MGFQAKIREEFLVLKSNLLKRPVFRTRGILPVAIPSCPERFLALLPRRFDYMAIFTL